MEVVNSGDWNNLPNVVLDQIFSYLSWSDKIKASSTCKRWRCGLYHPSLWKTLSFSLQSLNGDRVAKAHYFIETCARIVRSAHIIFDSLDCSSLSLTDELLDILRENSQLKKLMLIPSHGVLYPITSPCNSITLNSSRMYHHIFSILRNSDKFEELSIGCLDDVAVYSNGILKLISDLHSKSIRVLGLASLKCDPEDSDLSTLEYNYFQRFTNLQILSVNYDYVDDHFLMILQNCMSLKRIIIHIHNYSENHPGTTEGAWAELTKYCPKVELRLNIIHAHFAVLELHKSILKKNMPLTHLRVFFCEALNIDALNTLHVYHHSLRSLWWVDSPLYSDCEVLLRTNDVFNVGVMNPFIFVAWRCICLEELVLLGYKYFADDLRAISRLRGEALKRVHVLRSEMADSTLDGFVTQQITSREIEQEISARMGKSWKALKKRDVHPVLFCPNKYASDGYLLPILCQDLE